MGALYLHLYDTVKSSYMTYISEAHGLVVSYKRDGEIKHDIYITSTWS